MTGGPEVRQSVKRGGACHCPQMMFADEQMQPYLPNPDEWPDKDEVEDRVLPLELTHVADSYCSSLPSHDGPSRSMIVPSPSDRIPVTHHSAMDPF
jgi:hypothetical protein